MFDVTIAMNGVSASMFYDPTAHTYGVIVIDKDNKQFMHSDGNLKTVFDQMHPHAGDKVALNTARKFLQAVGKETTMLRVQRNTFIKEHKAEFAKMKAAIKRSNDAKEKTKVKKSTTGLKGVGAKKASKKK